MSDKQFEELKKLMRLHAGLIGMKLEVLIAVTLESSQILDDTKAMILNETAAMQKRLLREFDSHAGGGPVG